MTASETAARSCASQRPATPSTTYLDHLDVERGHRRQHHAVELPPRPRGATWRTSTRAGIAPSSPRSTESDVGGFLVSLRRGDEDPSAARDARRPRAPSSPCAGCTGSRWPRGWVARDVAADVHPPAPAAAAAQGPRRRPRSRSLLEALLLRRRPARRPRPRAARDALFDGRADHRDHRPRPRRRGRPSSAPSLLTGQGRQAAPGAGRVGPALAALEAYRVRARPGFATARPGDARRCSSTPAGARLSRQSAWNVLREAAERGGPDPVRSPRTPCGTRSRRTCSTAARTCAWCRSCSGHASVTTTQIYTLVTVDSLREVFAMAHPRARGGLPS